MIGGFDQFHFFKDCTPEETRKAVRTPALNKPVQMAVISCVLLITFFDADLELIEAFADEARKCVY